MADGPYPQGVPSNAQSDMISAETGLPAPSTFSYTNSGGAGTDPTSGFPDDPGEGKTSELVAGWTAPPALADHGRNGDVDPRNSPLPKMNFRPPEAISVAGTP